MKISNEISFSQQQQNELLTAATWVLEQEKLEAQSWEDAWSGMYPDKPTDVEIQIELERLTMKAQRMLSGSADLDKEHSSFDERLRMIALEYCPTLNIWQT